MTQFSNVETLPRPDGQPTTAQLINQATHQMQTLIRDELAMAKLELSQKGKRAGMGAGLFAGGGLIAVYGLGVLIACAVLALDLVWPAWLAALVVGVVLFIVAGGAFLVGRLSLKSATPPVPQDTKASLTADLDVVRGAFRDRSEHGT